MRKTRLVLIPGVKSLDTIGCLLLFLACPSIAFKGQENREVDTICKAQNLKEFWVDSPWPGDKENIGWVRGFGGGNWPGKSQQNTCSDHNTRSAVLSGRSDERRMQVRREIARDNGVEIRRIRLDNNEMRERRMRVDVGKVRDSRRLSDEERGQDSRRVRDDRRDSTSLDREMRFRSAESRIVTQREIINARRSSRASTRQDDREIRMKRDVRGTENRRIQSLNRELRSERMIREDGSRFRGSRRTSDERQSDINGGRVLATVDREVRSRMETKERRERSLRRLSDIDIRRIDSQGETENIRNDRFSTQSLNRRIRSDIEARELQQRRISRERESRGSDDFSDRKIARRDQRENVEVFRQSAALERNARLMRNFKESTSARLQHASFDSRESRRLKSLDRDRRIVLQSERDSRLTRSLERVSSTDDNRIDSRRHQRESRDARHLIRSVDRDVRSEREPEDRRNTWLPISSKRNHESQEKSNRKLSLENRNSEDVREVKRQENSPERSSRRVFDHERTNPRSARDEIRSPARIQRPTRSADKRTLVRQEDRAIDNRRNDIERETRNSARLGAERRSRQTTDTERAAIRQVQDDNRMETRFLREAISLDEATRFDTQIPMSRRENFRVGTRRRSDETLSRNRARSTPERHIHGSDQTRDTIRTNFERSSRGVNRRVRDDARLQTRIVREARSLEEVNRFDREIPESRRETTRMENRRGGDETLSRSRAMPNPERRMLSERLSRRVGDIERADIRRVRDDTRSQTRRLQEARSLEEVTRVHRHVPMSRRETTRVENRRMGDDTPSNRNQANTTPERQIGSDRTRDTIRTISERSSRRVGDIERVDIRRVRDQTRSLTRFLGETRSLEEVTRFDRQIPVSRREITRVEIRRSGEETLSINHASKTPERRLLSERLSRRVSDVERADIRQMRDDTKSRRQLHREAREEATRSDRQIPMSRRENIRVENRRSGDETLSRRAITTPQRHILWSDRTVRNTIRTIAEQSSRRVGDMERANIRRVRDQVRSQSLHLREARSVEEQTRFDRRMPSTETRREATRVLNIRNWDETLSGNHARTGSERTILGSDRKATRAISERSSRREGDMERVNIRRVRDEIRSRSQHLREPRFFEGETRFDRRMPSTESQRETNRVLNKRNNVETLSRNLARLNPEGMGPATDARRIVRREADRENKEILRVIADIRRTHRDAETRRILQRVSLKTDSIRILPKETRRSDRQRQVNIDQAMGKRLDNSQIIESTRRLPQTNEPSMMPQRLNIRERYPGKTDTMERELDGKLVNSAKNFDYFQESPKKAFASWLTADLRTDLNGIAETLMYGGIACFALFSNVNKKAIF